MNTSPVLEMIAATAAEHPGATAVVQGERSLTYGELAAAVPRFARALTAGGASAGAHVLLVLENRPEFAVAYFATAAAGCTVEAVDPDQPEEALRRRLADSRPAVVVTSASHPASTLAGRRVLTVDGPSADGPLPGASTDAQREAPGMNGPWVTALSSGSTGEPKRVLRTQAQQVAEADNITSTAGIGAGDVLLCTVPLFHALGQFCCLLAAVRSGATLVLPDRSRGASSVDAVVEALARHRVTLLIAVPQLFDAMADLAPDAPVGLGAVRLCLSGSNFLDPAVRRRFEARFGLPVRQTYGSTEAGSVCWDVGARPSPGTVGTPLRGARVRIVDERGTSLPPGATGEIVVSGRAVVDDPGSDRHRTGDLGTLDAQGRLTVTGRSRVLIDTGGHKVNPVEVERVLADHPLVADAGVAGVPLPGRGALLVAAVRLREGARAETGEILADCARRLPAHAVPRRARVVAQVPRTPLGKIRRTALAALLAEEREEKESGVRERLAALPGGQRRAGVVDHLRARVAEVVGTPLAVVDPCAPARSAGVDSLAAMRLRMTVHGDLGVRLPLPAVLGPRSLEELAGDLAEQLDGPVDETGAVPRGPVVGRFPLAPNQMSLWHAEHLDLGGSAYVVAFAARMPEGCDVEALRRAWTVLAHRHPVLRTTFPVHEGVPVQQVAAEARVDFETVPVPPSPDRTHREELIRSAFEPFDLAAQPPLRVRLRTGAPGGPVLVVSQHHLITDQWSTITMLHELAVLYAAETGNAEAYLPAPAHGYSDFAQWSLARARGPLGAEDLAHWTHRLTPPPPPADLPTDLPRPAVRGQRGATVRRDLSPARAAAVRAHAEAAGTSPFAVLLAVFHVLLHTCTGRADSAVGVNTANRERPEFADVLGYFTNTVVHRVGLSPDQSFASLLDSVTEALLTGLEHGAVTLEDLLGEVKVPRDRGRAPLVEVGFGQSAAQDPAQAAVGELLSAERDGVRVPLGPLVLETVALGRTGAVYDLAATVSESGGSLWVTWEYDTDLFTSATVGRLASRYEALADTLLAAPGTELGRLPASSAPPAGRLPGARVDPPGAGRAWQPVAERVRRRAEAEPAAPAVVDGEETTAYGELDRAAVAVAARLEALAGLGPSSVVAVAAGRAGDLAAGSLGVLRAGLVCAPVTAGGPGSAGLSLSAELSEVGAAALVDMTGSADVPYALPVVRPDGTSAPPPLRPAPQPGAPALVVRTSGTTGARRPVLLDHGTLTRAVREDGRGEVLIVRGAADRLAADLLTTLAAGGTAVPLAPAVRLEELARGRAAVSAPLTPTELAGLVSRLEREGGTPSVGTLVVGGEPLGRDLVRRWRSRVPHGRLVHAYGGAEWGPALCEEEVSAEVPSDSGPDAEGGDEPVTGIVPVGRPPAGSLLCVVDPWNRASPTGVPGEVCVGARDAAAALSGTAQEGACLRHPLVPDAWVRRTGDAGVLLPDGRLAVLGRIAQIHSEDGYHHAPARVERALRRRPGVRAAVVTGGGSEEPTAVVESDGTVRESALREALRQEMPAHLLPRLLLYGGELPRTPDGKTALTLRSPAAARDGSPGHGAGQGDGPGPAAGAGHGSGAAEEMSAVEAGLAAVWREILGLGHVGLDDDYYALGGDSVQAVRIATKAAEKGLQVTRRHLFTHPTIRSLARVTTSSAGAATVSRSFARRRSIPLTPVQRWFFELELPDPGHWNQSVALLVPRSPSPAALLDAVRAVAGHHDVLRHRFRRRETEWEQVGDPTAETVAVEEVPVADEAAFPGAVGHARRGVDLSAGPLLRATLIRHGAGPHLLVLTAHHLVVDVLSWGVLLDGVRAACAQRSAGEPVRLPPVPLTYDRWARTLRQHADDLAPRADPAVWDDPQDAPGPPPTTYESGSLLAERALRTAHTGALLEGLRARGAHPADAVAGAVACAVAAELGRRTVRIVTELHGREQISDGEDPSRTVGWFTALAPLLVDAAPEAGPCQVLDGVRAARARGLEHGLLRYGTSDAAVRSRLARADRPWASVNYLGSLGREFTGTRAPGDGELPLVPLPEGGDRGPSNPRPFHWEFSAFTREGRLLLRLGHAGDDDLAERLLEAACDRLVALAADLDTARPGETR